MELKHLKRFVAVAESGSFVSASKIVGLAQPPLSISIRKLEAELDVTLFERHGRGVTLTSAGEEMLGRAQEIVARVTSLRKFMREMASGARASLKIGFVGSATSSLLPRLMQAYRGAHPLVDIELLEMTTREALGGIESRTLDIGIIRTPLMDSTHLEIQPAEKDRLVLIAPPGYPLGGSADVRLEDLREAPFVMYDRTKVPNLHTVAVNACKAAGFMPNVVQEATQVQSLIALVESGFGVALIPSLAARRINTRARLFEITAKSHLNIGLAIATSSEFKTRATQWFCEEAAKAAHESASVVE
jgi:DNA-binding transcriptional LysR family regulator